MTTDIYKYKICTKIYYCFQYFFPFCSAYIIHSYRSILRQDNTTKYSSLNYVQKRKPLITRYRLNRSLTGSAQLHSRSFIRVAQVRYDPLQLFKQFQRVKTNITRTRKTKHLAYWPQFSQIFFCEQQLQYSNTMIIIYLNLNMMVGRTQIGLMWEFLSSKCQMFSEVNGKLVTTIITPGKISVYSLTQEFHSETNFHLIWRYSGPIGQQKSPCVRS